METLLRPLEKFDDQLDDDDDDDDDDVVIQNIAFQIFFFLLALTGT